MSKVIFLDRDGVINQDSPFYIKTVDEFIFLPKSVEAIALLHKAGYKIGVATNQSGVARGYYSLADLESIHEKMLQEIRRGGGEIDAIAFCPHLPEEKCGCRKPEPGLLLKLAKRLCVNLKGQYFIGDRISDIEVALQVGAKPLLILSSMTDRAALLNYPQVPIFNSLWECVNWMQLDA